MLNLFLRYFPDFSGYEMDEIRAERLPGPVHDAAKRAAAYRLMHFEAVKKLEAGISVAVSAVYYPLQARAELAEIARRYEVDLYVVQSVCDAHVAVSRFIRRERTMPHHAGADLTVSQVMEYANTYRPFDGALTIDTTDNPRPAQILRTLQTCLNASRAIEPCSWALHWYWKSAPQAPQDAALSQHNKFSRAVLRSAYKEINLIRVGVAFMGICIFLGILPLLGSYRSFWSTLKSWHFGIRPGSWSGLATWGTFGIAAAGIVGVFLAFFKEMMERWNSAQRVRRSADAPVYQVPALGWSEPSDVEISRSYQCRIPSETWAERMPVPDTPLYFAIPPRANRAFHVTLVRSDSVPPSELERDAVGMGLDWSAFANWRWQVEKQRYPLNSISAEKNLRCVSSPRLSGSANEYVAEALVCSYPDYISREYSVNLWAPGVLPDMRRLLEGPGWDHGTLDLSSCEEGAKRYSMRVSITALLLTDDQEFVLQRRSAHVASGIGNLAASANGAVDYRADAIRRRLDPRGPRRWDLGETVMRELREETGVADDSAVLFDSHGPFIGAAFNLKYGRDLNFYAVLRSPMKSFEVGECRKSRGARDRWEVDHLEFLKADAVTLQSIRNGKLERRLVHRSRHLMGALYAWAVYAGR